MSKNALIPYNPQGNPPTPDEAHAVYIEILERKNLIAHNFIELGRLFKEIRDREMYKLLDHDCFNSFIGSPEIAFSRSTVYSLIDIYELFIIESKYAQDDIAKIPWSKLNMIKGAYKKTKDPDLLFKAETLSQKDLLDEVHLLEGRPLKEYKPPKEEKPKPKLTDFKQYKSFVKAYGCIFGCKEEADPHHFPKTKGAGAPDHWVIPLCRKCHSLYQEQIETFLTTYRNQIFKYFYDLILSIFMFIEDQGDKK